MKTLLVAINSKYIHSSLAVWYLKENCGKNNGELKVIEFTINDIKDSVLASIFLEKADNVAFSCYIWNVSFVLDIARNLKKVSPGIKIILGGPEVSYDPKTILEDNKFIDFIIAGEGEITFDNLVGFLANGQTGLEEIAGICYRKDGSVIINKPQCMIADLDNIASPYTDEMLESLGNRIVYFESSRGCPFSCSYCISSTFEGVRYFSIKRVKKELKRLVDRGIHQIKFVDRTFNCNKVRAKEIFEFIIEYGGNTNFHFEAAADLFDDHVLEILSKAPRGLIQFEIGVQTTNTETLEEIDRKTDISKVFEFSKRLLESNKFHIHMDLIAGLPFEDYQSFANSFNDLYEIQPHQLQLGFLKILKGAKIRREAETHGYVYRNEPPYEILENNYISFEEIIRLKSVEELVERYYNANRLKESLNFVIKGFFKSPFNFYEKFMEFNKSSGYLQRPMAGRELYRVFVEFIKPILPESYIGYVMDLVKLDFLSSEGTMSLPEGIGRQEVQNFKERCFEFLKDEQAIKKYLPDFVDMPAKQIFKKVHFEVFDYDVAQVCEEKSITSCETIIMFDFNKRDDITGLYRYFKVEL